MINLVEAAQTTWWLHKNCRRLHKCSTKMTFHLLLLVPFHTYLGGMFLVYIPMYSTIWNKVDWRIFRTASWHLLHHSVWVYGGILIHPLCCIFFLRLYTRLLHRLPISAPGPCILGCVGWFFESVVRWIIDLGCRLKTVVGLEFYSLGCTSLDSGYRLKMMVASSFIH
jgi:hypothetical protein